jgi:hypothetical protein
MTKPQNGVFLIIFPSQVRARARVRTREEPFFQNFYLVSSLVKKTSKDLTYF